MITTAGAQLSKSEKADTRKKLDDVMRTLDRLGQDVKQVPSRIRFLIKDILDLKRTNWVPRREVFTAKKLDEVRAQAEAELGMISTAAIAAVLPTLPAQQRMGGPAVEEIPLIPPLRGAGGADADFVQLFPPLRSQQAAGSGFGYSNPNPGSRSALMGDFQPVNTSAPSTSQPAQPAQPASGNG